MLKRYLIICLLAGPFIISCHGQEPEAVDIAAPEQVTEQVDAQMEEPASGQPEELVAGQILPVAVLALGEVDGNLAERARKWAADNLAIPVPVLDPHPDARLETFDEVAAYAAKIMEENRVGLVVLWMPASGVMNHGAHFPEQRVVIANLKPFYSDDANDDLVGRRLERQVIRGVCILMGLEPSPIPQSAMYAYSSLEELDQIGRNLDPPWLIRLQQRAVELGIPVDPDSPFNLISISSDDE